MACVSTLSKFIDFNFPHCIYMKSNQQHVKAICIRKWYVQILNSCCEHNRAVDLLIQKSNRGSNIKKWQNNQKKNSI